MGLSSEREAAAFLVRGQSGGIHLRVCEICGRWILVRWPPGSPRGGFLAGAFVWIRNSCKISRSCSRFIWVLVGLGGCMVIWIGGCRLVFFLSPLSLYTQCECNFRPVEGSVLSFSRGHNVHLNSSGKTIRLTSGGKVPPKPEIDHSSPRACRDAQWRTTIISPISRDIVYSSQG